MPHVTDYGYTPTHLWPSREDVPTHYGAFFLDEGESIPCPGSTKHLWHGPGLYIYETKGMAFRRFEFDLPPMKSTHRNERCGWLSTPNLGKMFDLGPYPEDDESGARTFADLVTFVEPRPNVDDSDEEGDGDE